MNISDATSPSQRSFHRVWKLSLAFRGTLNDKPGFYRGSYKDDRGIAHSLAATQFERRTRGGLPCWDEPHFKAVFCRHLSHRSGVDGHLEYQNRGRTAGERQNTSFDSPDPAEDVHYLVAFIVGELVSTAPIMAKQTPVRHGPNQANST